MDPNTTVHSHLFGSEKPTSPLHHNPPSGNPTGHGFESIFGQIMKHLNALESNHHLLLKYAKDQVLGLGNSSLKVQSDLVKLEKINTTPEPSDQEFGLLDHIYQAHRAGPIPEHHCDPDLLQHDPNSTWKQSYKRCGNSGEEVFTTTDERFSIVGNNGRQERALPRLLPPSQACPPLFSLTAVAQTRLEEARLAAQTSRFPLPSPSETTQRESQWTGRARTCSPLSLVHALHQFACMNSSDDQANVAIIPKIQDYLEKACSIVCCIITKRSTLLYSASKKLQAISDPRTYTTIENLAQRVIRTCLAIKNQAISKPSESLMNLGRFSDDLLVRLMSHYSTLPDIRDLQSPGYCDAVISTLCLAPKADQYLRSIDDWMVLLTVGLILKIQAKEGKTILSIQPDPSSSSSENHHQVILEPFMDQFASALKNNSHLAAIP
ncbi:uncharacterized protein PGTG_19631, partial [Puccinia graminis f. sp. tritici CRL 75-36-700-3]